MLNHEMGVVTVAMVYVAFYNVRNTVHMLAQSSIGITRYRIFSNQKWWFFLLLLFSQEIESIPPPRAVDPKKQRIGAQPGKKYI